MYHAMQIIKFSDKFDRAKQLNKSMEYRQKIFS